MEFSFSLTNLWKKICAAVNPGSKKEEHAAANQLESYEDFVENLNCDREGQRCTRCGQSKEPWIKKPVDGWKHYGNDEWFLDHSILNPEEGDPSKGSAMLFCKFTREEDPDGIYSIMYKGALYKGSQISISSKDVTITPGAIPLRVASDVVYGSSLIYASWKYSDERNKLIELWKYVR